MNEAGLRWYILFDNYEQGLALHELLTEDGIKNRIAPTPRAIQGELSCGMSLLLEPDHVDAAKDCIARHRAEYHSMVSLAGQINAHRDRYC